MPQLPKWIKNGLAVILLVGIFTGGYFFRMFLHEKIEYRVVSVRNSSTVTSAITDRYEIQLTDRSTGHVRIYEKDVLDAIYYQYSARRKFTQEDQKP